MSQVGAILKFRHISTRPFFGPNQTNNWGQSKIIVAVNFSVMAFGIRCKSFLEREFKGGVNALHRIIYSKK
jgi:hypothetical protein